MSKKNRNLARFIQEVAVSHYGSFLYHFAHAYEHADGANQTILDPAFDLFDQKYSITTKYISMREQDPNKGVM